MSKQLFRLLMIGYGLAGICAVALWLGGAGALVAGLTFWIGGAVAVLAVAALMTRGGANADARRADVVRDDELMRWEQDRRLDAAAATEGAARQTG